MLPLLLLKDSSHSSVSLTQSCNAYISFFFFFYKQLKPAVNLSRGIFCRKVATACLPARIKRLHRREVPYPWCELVKHRGACSGLWDVPVDLWQLLRVCDQVVETIEVGWGEKITKVSEAGLALSLSSSQVDWSHLPSDTGSGSSKNLFPAVMY